MENWRTFPLTGLKPYGNRTVGSLTIAELKDLRANWMACMAESRSRRTLSAGELALFQALTEALTAQGLEAPPSISERKEDPPALKEAPNASPPQQGLKLPMPTAPLQPKTAEIAVPQLPPAPIGRRPVSQPAAREPASAEEHAPESSDDRRDETRETTTVVEQSGQELRQADSQPQASSSEEPAPYERAPLREIIAHHGIKGIHPAADLLPLMSDGVFQSVCLDVKAQGFLEPVEITEDDLLLDGRNRIQVGQALGIDPPIRRVNPPDPVAYVIGKNVSRRHLSVGQRAMVAEKLASLRRGSNQFQKVDVPIGTSSMTRTQAGTLLSVTPQEISKARIVRELAPTEAAKVEQGELSLDAAYKKAKRKIAPDKARSGTGDETEDPKKPPKRKKQPGGQDDSAELEASPDNSSAVPQESAEVESKATREDCITALFIFVEVLANSSDEPFDATLLSNQDLDIAKFRAVWPKLMALMRTVRDFISPPT
jgi:hypothetical protein